MRTVTILHLFLILPVVFIACSGTTKTAIPDPAAPQSKFLASIASYPYHAPPGRVSALLRGYQNLTKGMNPDQVAKLLGEPDAKVLEVDRKNKTIGGCWSYYITIPSNPKTNPVNPVGTDWEVINLCFDRNGKLYYASPRNIEGLSQMGSISDNLYGVR